MARKLPPLNAVRAFEAAGRHQSFTGAASELSVSHSAISRHVRGLEHSLGVQLFRDLPRGVALTDAGRRYLERVTSALDVLATATEDLTEAPAGRVTVNSEQLFAEKFIVPRLGSFHKEFPEIEVRLEASQELANVDRYEADLAVRFAVTGALDLPSDLLSNAPIYPFAAPDVAKNDLQSPADILRYPLLRDRQANTWSAWCEAAGLGPGAVPDMPWRLRAELAYAAALHGQGILMCSSECASFDVEAGRLVQCSDIGIQSGAFRLVYSSRGNRRKAVNQFRQWLLDETKSFRQAKAH